MTTTSTPSPEHRPGCDALGGYGHGVGPCNCGASPEAEALPTLPVVAWHFECMKPGKCETFASVFEDDSTHWPIDQWKKVTKSALTSHAPAEAAIVALRAEVAELQKERDALQEKVRDYALQLMVDDAQAMGLYDTPGSLLGDGGTL